MKTPVFTVTGVMACLMLLSRPVNAQITAGATFNLQAEIKRATCNALTFSGDADNAGNVDFGVISLADASSVKKTKQVVLRLHCDSSPPPMVAGIGFRVGSGIATSEGMLYPDDLSLGFPLPNINLSYYWQWGSEINQTVVKSPGGGRAGLLPGLTVNLGQNTTSKQYLLVQEAGKTDWDFPMDITRNAMDIATLSAGEYSAAVTVNISYE